MNNKDMVMRYGVMLVLMSIVGCGILHEEIVIADGIRWRLYGVKDSCLIMKFCDKSIRGDLHIEFLEHGLLVSIWDKSIGEHRFGYVNLRDSTFDMIDGNVLPTYLGKMRNAKKVVRSYCLFCLVGRNKIDSEKKSFDVECEELALRLDRARPLTQNLKR